MSALPAVPLDRAELRARAAERMAIAAQISERFNGPSLLEAVASTPEGMAWLEGLSPLDATRLLHSWEFNARPKQLLPQTPWETCILCAGRGFGKNRTGAEFVRQEIFGGRSKACILIGPTEKETLRYMVGGRKKEKGSGFFDVLAPWEHACCTFLDAKKEIRIAVPGHGDATIYLNSGEDRELRGAGIDLVWLDEPIKIARVRELLDNIFLALREGDAPRLLITTTPKANAEWLRELLCDPGTIVRRGSTHENSALSKAAVARMVRRFGGTRLAAQELEGELLSDAPGTLFKQSLIDQHRVIAPPVLDEILITVDPSKSGRADADECGIVAMGRGRDRHLYVLADGTQRSDPIVWVAEIARLHEVFGARCILVEDNNLGRHAVSSILAYWPEGRPKPSIREVHAVSDKLSRAEPLSILYERGRIHHVGLLGRLEDELVNYEPGGKSPNGLDAVGQGAEHLTHGYTLR